MSLKDFFSKKQKNDAKIGGKNVKSSVEDTSTFTFNDDDFKKNDKDGHEIDLNTLNQTELNKNHISLHTDVDDETFFTNKFDTVDDFETKLNEITSKGKDKKVQENITNDLTDAKDALDFSDMDISALKDSNKSTEDLTGIDEQTLMAMYEEENASSKNQVVEEEEDEEDELLQSQMKELNDLYENGGALNNEEKKDSLKSSSLNFNDSDFNRNTTTSTTEMEDSFFKLNGKTDKTTTTDNDLSLSEYNLNDSNNLDISSISSLEAATVDSGLPQVKKKSSLKKKEHKKSIFGNASVKSQYLMFFSTLIFGVAGLGGSLFYSSQTSSVEAEASKLTSALGGEVEQFSSKFRDSLLGRNGAYAEMLKHWANMSAYNKNLIESVNDLKNNNINKYSENIVKNIQAISANVEYLKTLELVLKDTANKKEFLVKNIDELSDLTNKIGFIYTQVGMTQAEMSSLYALKTSLDNLKTSSVAILIGETVNVNDISEIENSTKLLQSKIEEIYNGNPDKNINKMNPIAVPLYNKFISNWNEVSVKISDVAKNADSLAKAKSIAKSNSELTVNLSKDIAELTKLYNGYAHSHSDLIKSVLIVSILLLVISLIGLAYVYRFESRKKEAELKDEAERNKKSIFKLLNEMIPLQDGNLTQKTTVEEGITLDIADSINATIDSLAVVVKKIKNSSFVMKEKTNEINISSMNLLNSSEQQANSIVDANESINKITKAINEISEKTKNSLKIAQKSASASSIGAQHVKDSIESMTTISKNMDETVLLMNKVSDSSRQISEVIGLLSDITEETNILALNATVQAAKAGEAGKGFKVVADSIQELADNAAEATRRVGALIATVQTDIQSVGASIEKTTKEVERGVELSENAGKCQYKSNCKNLVA